MKTVNSVSGGKSSAFMAKEFPSDVSVFSVVCIENCPEHKTDPYLLRYANDKFSKFCPNYPEFSVTAEDDRTLWAMIELEQLLGKEIVWVRGKSFDTVIDEATKTRLPSWARRYCTSEMKMIPIFEYLYLNGLLPCYMNIGFRADEPNRKRNMYFEKDGLPKNPHHFHYPTSCKNYGEHKQNWEYIYWRRAHFPLVENGITKQVVADYWKGKIDFPEISNCEGCFHKNIETIAVMCHQSSKMAWWMRQEKKNKGTWREDNLTYETISKSKLGRQLTIQNVSGCESEGCTA